jgi:hypothetical protein
MKFRFRNLNSQEIREIEASDIPGLFILSGTELTLNQLRFLGWVPAGRAEWSGSGVES